METKHYPNISIENVFTRLGERNDGVSFLKSHSDRGWQTFLGWCPIDQLVYRREQQNRERALLDFQKKHGQKGIRIIGYFSYDLGYELFDLNQSAEDDLQLPDMFFQAYENYLVSDNKDGLTVHFSNNEFLEEVEKIFIQQPVEIIDIKVQSNFTPELNKEKYIKAYSKIKKYIVEGDIYQINLTHRLHAQVKAHPRSMFQKLLENNPVDFMAYIEGQGFEILSASPERFVRITNSQIETCPVKGTRPRGHTPEEDNRLKNELLESQKEAAELNMITDLLRNDVGKVAKIGTVRVVDKRIAEPYPGVWHTFSRVRGELQEGITSSQAVLSMLPGGSITGCPKKRAMEIIDELEPTTRSVYTGAIGCFLSNGDADFNIAIRTMIKKGDDLYLQVGGGIVYDSNEKAEYQETFDKAKPFIRMLEAIR